LKLDFHTLEVFVFVKVNKPGEGTGDFDAMFPNNNNNNKQQQQQQQQQQQWEI